MFDLPHAEFDTSRLFSRSSEGCFPVRTLNVSYEQDFVTSRLDWKPIRVHYETCSNEVWEQVRMDIVCP